MPPKKRKANQTSGEPPKTKDKKEQAKEPTIDWKNSAAKGFLKECFKDGRIPLDYSDSGGPRLVWDTLCNGNPAFHRMVYGGTFTGRLRGVLKDHLAKENRKVIDQIAFDNFRVRHPRQKVDHQGHILWHGSDAERLLKEDMKKGVHEKMIVDTKTGKERQSRPKDFWLSREEFQCFNLTVFRDHMYQERRKWKNENYLKTVAASKQKVIKDPPKKSKKQPKATDGEAEEAGDE